MKSDILIYAIAIVAVVLTFGASIVLPVPDSYRGIITLPGLLALFGIVIEAWRDKRAHERRSICWCASKTTRWP